jgi:hypothetical protein
VNPMDQLMAELDQWNFSGEEATFWWRDDDARSNGECLERLLALACRYDVPAALAVIPKFADDSLQSKIADQTRLSVLQHGFAHINYASDDEKKQELGVHRSLEAIHSDLSTGFSRLGAMFQDRFIPVLVPPWNRIDSSVIPGLAATGLIGLSCDGPRRQPEPADNIWQINTHADIIDWKRDKQFIGQQQVIDRLVSHLCGKREGRFDAAEPTGILTHHLVHDEDCWQFLDDLFAAMDDHPAVTWLSAARVFQSAWR